MSEKKITFHKSSGNVFADLGLADADNLMAKAELALAIRRRIEEMGLTQTQAAEVMGTTQARVSELYNAKVMKMTFDRLLGFLNALQCDAYISIAGRDEARGKERGETLVTASPTAADNKRAVPYTKRTYATQDGATVEIEIQGGQTRWTERLADHAPMHTYTFDRQKTLEIRTAFRNRTQGFLQDSHTALFGADPQDHAQLSAWDCGYLAALLEEAATWL